MLALSTSATVPAAARETAPVPGLAGAESSVNAALESIPAPAPLRSTTGASLTTVIVVVAVAVAESAEPSFTLKVTLREVASGSWSELSYSTVRRTCW